MQVYFLTPDQPLKQIQVVWKAALEPGILNIPKTGISFFNFSYQNFYIFSISRATGIVKCWVPRFAGQTRWNGQVINKKKQGGVVPIKGASYQLRKIQLSK